MTHEEAVKAKSDKKNWCKHCLIVNRVKPKGSPSECQPTCRLEDTSYGQYADCDFEGEYTKCDKFESVL